MADHVSSALFVYTPETEYLRKSLQDNPFDVKITSIAFDTLLKSKEGLLDSVDHLVVSGSLDVIKEILFLSMKNNFSVGLIPMNVQKDLIKCFALPKQAEDAIDLALKQDAPAIDLILCNQQIILFKATIGRLPLLDSPADISKMNILVKALKKFKGLELLPVDLITSEQKKIRTAVCGCMILQHQKGTVASRLISLDSSLSDGMISLLVSAPRSIIGYLTFLGQAFKTTCDLIKMPKTIGYIKSPWIDIKFEKELGVYIDGTQTTQTPVRCEALKEAVCVNIGSDLRKENNHSQPVKERIDIANLPIGRELQRVKTKNIPFFSYASEERFRDLLTALHSDARINTAYLVLMVLSTILATVGLYLDSASVVIGAMLLAPLMTPIVSLSMGLLRQDNNMSKSSLIKIITGIMIALMTSALISMIYPSEQITSEMAGRLHPTLLDLSVAIISGIAGAYTKSFKEILQSLAGVAIAVALVPPLAVAGIGIGRLDPNFFGEAFLLFVTNLIGIVLAATLTFRVLGYSSAIRGKRSLGLVVLFLILILVPLSLSFNEIIANQAYEKSWRDERFLVNEKYLIVLKANVQNIRDKKVLKVEVLAREPLTRNDLTKLSKKIQFNFSKKLVIRLNVIYIP